MAIEIIQSPNKKQHSAFNPVWHVVTSTNKYQDQFRYVYDILSGNSLNGDFVQRYLVPPRPVDGYGILDVSNYVSTFIYPHFSASTLGYAPASGSAFSYRVKIGETTPYWEFYDNYFGFSAGTAFVGFSGETEHNLQAGDKIVVQQDQPYTNESYQGEHSILYVQSPYIAVTSTPTANSTTPEGGRIYKQNGEPFINSGITLTPQLTAFNLALTSKEFSQNEFLGSYNIINEGKFFTNCPDEINMLSANYALVSQFNFGDDAVMRIDTYDVNDSLVGRYRFNNEFYSGVTRDEEIVLHFGIGVKNLNETPTSLYDVISGNSSVINDQVTYYKYFITNQTSLTGETKTVNIICNPTERTNYQLLFLDRFGSWFPFNFYFESQEQHNINRKVFQKSVLPNLLSNDPYLYTQDRGATVYNTDIKKSITVSSDWLSDEESEYMMNLLSSPEVYHIDGDGDILPVVINSGNYTKQENINGLISYQFSFQYAFDDGVQNY